MLSADVAHLSRGASLIGEGIEGQRDGRNLRVAASTSCVAFYQLPRHGDFRFGGLGQRNTHRIAQPVFKQRADADRAFDAPILTISGLRHTEVQRVVHPLVIHSFDQQAIRLHHDLRVRGFHRNHQFMVVVIAAYAQKFQGTFHHPHRSVTISAHDPI